MSPQDNAPITEAHFKLADEVYLIPGRARYFFGDPRNQVAQLIANSERAAVEEALSKKSPPWPDTMHVDRAISPSREINTGVTFLCPTCRKNDRVEVYPSAADKNTAVIYCRRCEEGCVPPLIEVSPQSPDSP